MALWTPAEITTALWLDASDSGTITLDGSSNVEQLDDKSGDDNHFTQTTEAKRPAMSAINGVDAIDLSGGDHLTGPAITDGWASPDFSVFAVVCPRSLRAVSPYFHTILAQGSYSSHDYLLCLDSRSSQSPTILLNSDATRLEGNSQSADDVAMMIGLVGESGAQAFYVDATQDSTFTVTTNWAYIIGSRTSVLGTESGGRTLESDLGELIIINDVVPESDRQKIEGYLAHKWGLEANLPAGHPYKDAAPVTDEDETADTVTVTDTISDGGDVRLSTEDTVTVSDEIEAAKTAQETVEEAATVADTLADEIKRALEPPLHLALSLAVPSLGAEVASPRIEVSATVPYITTTF